MSVFESNHEPSTIKVDGPSSKIVYLNIGGTNFQTFEDTLTKFESKFRHIFLLKDKTPLFDKQGRLFFDRPSRYFKMILDVLQKNETEVVLNQEDFLKHKDHLMKEIIYYGFEKSLKVRIYSPPEPPLHLRILDFIFNFRYYLYEIIRDRIVLNINLDYDEFAKKCILFSTLCLSIFSILLFLVSIHVIHQKMYILFWPLYGISFSIAVFLFVLIIHFIKNESPYLFGCLMAFTFNIIITISNSFLFSKVYYWYHGLPYYSWTLVNIVPLIASIVVICIFMIFHCSNSFKTLMNFSFTSMIINSTPLVIFWTIWSLTLYMDEIYFKSNYYLIVPFMILIFLIVVNFINVGNGTFLTLKQKIMVTIGLVGNSFNFILVSYFLHKFNVYITFLPFIFSLFYLLKLTFEFL